MIHARKIISDPVFLNRFDSSELELI